MKFNYAEIFITIATDNIQLLVEFYNQFLQRQPDIYRSNIYAEYQLVQFRLGIFKPKIGGSRQFENRGSSISFCLEVEDLEKAIAHISELGYPPPGEIIVASHGREIYAYDPIGNRIILHKSLGLNSKK